MVSKDSHKHIRLLTALMTCRNTFARRASGCYLPSKITKFGGRRMIL